MMTNDGRPARRILRPGDPCPCCGQPISATDEQVLLCLTRIAELTLGYEWPKGETEVHE